MGHVSSRYSRGLHNRGNVPGLMWKEVQSSSLNTTASSTAAERLRALSYERRTSDRDVTMEEAATILNDHQESLARHLGATSVHAIATSRITRGNVVIEIV